MRDLEMSGCDISNGKKNPQRENIRLTWFKKKINIFSLCKSSVEAEIELFQLKSGIYPLCGKCELEDGEGFQKKTQNGCLSIGIKLKFSEEYVLQKSEEIN